MSKWEREKELTELASLDEGEDYEVDESFIGLDAAGKFILLTASGCSCWDGDYEEEAYDSLDALEAALITDDRTYNPSLNGARRLIDDARTALAKLQVEAVAH